MNDIFDELIDAKRAYREMHILRFEIIAFILKYYES